MDIYLVCFSVTKVKKYVFIEFGPRVYQLCSMNSNFTTCNVMQNQFHMTNSSFFHELN